MILTLSLPSHHQIPVHLWTLKTRRLSRIPIRHEPAKGQRHNQNPSTLSTIHLESHLPHAKTLTTVVSPYPVNKLTVYYTHLCVWQFRYRRSDPTEDEEAVNSGSPKGMFGDRQPAVYLIKNNAASRSDDDGSAA